MLDDQFEQWHDIRDSLLYTRPAIPFRETDISFRNQTLLQKWCNIEFTPEQVFDANNEYEQFWRRSQHEQLNWCISDTCPIFYVWGNDEKPLFESRTRELTIRRRYVTLRQLETYDLSHLLAPEPKDYSMDSLVKMTGTLKRNIYDAPIFYPRANIVLPNRVKVDFYDVLDVVYALHLKHLNGRFDYTRLKRFWDARLNAYHDADIG
jgi:hypothetical protein